MSQQKELSLVAGYMRHKIATSDDMDLSIFIKVILAYFGSLYVRFDVFHPRYTNEILDDGKRLRRLHSKTTTFGCSSGFSSGIHKISIKCIDPGYERIGIATELTQCEKEEGRIERCKYAYYYYHYVGVYIKDNIRDSQILKHSAPWEKGDIISVVINCEQWNVSFHHNEERVGMEYDIEPNLCYYYLLHAHPSHACEYEFQD